MLLHRQAQFPPRGVREELLISPSPDGGACSHLVTQGFHDFSTGYSQVVRARWAELSTPRCSLFCRSNQRSVTKAFHGGKPSCAASYRGTQAPQRSDTPLPLESPPIKASSAPKRCSRPVGRNIPTAPAIPLATASPLARHNPQRDRMSCLTLLSCNVHVTFQALSHQAGSPVSTVVHIASLGL